MEDNQLDEIKKILEENSAAINLLTADMESIKKYMRARTIISVVWIIIVLLPTLLAAMYLPGLVKSYSSNVTNWMDLVNSLY